MSALGGWLPVVTTRGGSTASVRLPDVLAVLDAEQRQELARLIDRLADEAFRSELPVAEHIVDALCAEAKA